MVSGGDRLREGGEGEGEVAVWSPLLSCVLLFRREGAMFHFAVWPVV